VGLEQAVEHLRLGPGVAVAAVGAGEVLELLAGLLLEVVGAVALVARGALDQRVDEGLHVPEVSQTSRARMTHESRPTTSSRPCTTAFHHWRLTLFLSSTPSGP
jgi:hypothetical protein